MKDKGEIVGTKLKSNETVTEEVTAAPKPHAEAPVQGNTCANLFAGNKSSENGMVLSYIPPEIVDNIVVKLDKDGIDAQNKKWECALIIYVIGNTLRYKFMERYIAQTWSRVVIPVLYLHKDGYYIAKFNTLGVLKDILYGGPYTINGRPMILKQWTPDFDLKAEFLTEIPLWITFPKLLISYWGNKTLSQLASAIQKPLFADECTTKQTRISYARILVEANVTKKTSNRIDIARAFREKVSATSGV